MVWLFRIIYANFEKLLNNFFFVLAHTIFVAWILIWNCFCVDLLFGYYVSMIGYFVSISSPNRLFSWGEDVDITAKSGLFSQMRVFVSIRLPGPYYFIVFSFRLFCFLVVAYQLFMFWFFFHCFRELVCSFLLWYFQNFGESFMLG